LKKRFAIFEDKGYFCRTMPAQVTHQAYLDVTPTERRWVCFFLFALVFIQGLVMNLTPLILPTLEDVLRLNKSQLGLFSSAGVVGMMLALFVGGYVVQILRPIRSGTLAVIIMGCGAVLMAYAPSYPIVLLAAFVLSVGTSWIVAVQSAIVTTFFFKRRQRMYFLVLAFMAAGAMVGPWVFTFFLERVGQQRWQLVYLGGALALWILIGLILMIGGKSLIVLKRQPAPDPTDVSRPSASEGFLQTLFHHVLNRPTIYLLGLIVICDNLAMMSVLTWTPTLAQERFGVGDQQTGAMMSLMAASVLFGRVLMAALATGRIADRFLLGGCYALSMLCFMLMLMSPSFTVMLVMWAAMSFFVAAQGPATYAIGSSEFKGRAGIAIPIADGIGTLGSMLGPPLLGYYSDLTHGGLLAALWIVPIFGFGVTLVSIVWELIKRQELARRSNVCDESFALNRP
jgi:AAHS family 3-hydroxyphenylpropionic acid transporter